MSAVSDDERAAAAAADFWPAIFGNRGPVEIEIGSGDGAFLLTSAVRRSAVNHLGIERSPAKARRLEMRVARAGLANVRVLQADATCLVTRLLPGASVAAYHVYFPDPWPKRGHAHRRILHTAFVTGLARTLAPGGHLFLATDVQAYAAVARDRVLSESGWREVDSGDAHPGLSTSFARKYRAAGRTLFAYTFVRVGAAADAQPLAPSKTRSM